MMDDVFDSGLELTGPVDDIPPGAPVSGDFSAEEQEWLDELYRNINDSGIESSYESSRYVDREVISPAHDPAFAPQELEPDFTDAPRDVWSVSEYPGGSGLCAQMYIINEFTGADFTEDELREAAVSEGALSSFGTHIGDMDSMLEHYGIDTELRFGSDIDSLGDALSGGSRALAAIDGSAAEDAPLLYGCDRIVEVVSIGDGMVTVNDPADVGGMMKQYTYEEFDRAWSYSGRACVVALRP